MKSLGIRFLGVDILLMLSGCTQKVVEPIPVSEYGRIDAKEYMSAVITAAYLMRSGNFFWIDWRKGWRGFLDKVAMIFQTIHCGAEV